MQVLTKNPNFSPKAEILHLTGEAVQRCVFGMPVHQCTCSSPCLHLCLPRSGLWFRTVGDPGPDGITNGEIWQVFLCLCILHFLGGAHFLGRVCFQLVSWACPSRDVSLCASAAASLGLNGLGPLP